MTARCSVGPPHWFCDFDSRNVLQDAGQDVIWAVPRRLDLSVDLACVGVFIFNLGIFILGFLGFLFSVIFIVFFVAIFFAVIFIVLFFCVIFLVLFLHQRSPLSNVVCCSVPFGNQEYFYTNAVPRWMEPFCYPTRLIVEPVSLYWRDRIGRSGFLFWAGLGLV